MNYGADLQEIMGGTFSDIVYLYGESTLDEILSKFLRMEFRGSIWWPTHFLSSTMKTQSLTQSKSCLATSTQTTVWLRQTTFTTHYLRNFGKNSLKLWNPSNSSTLNSSSMKTRKRLKWTFNSHNSSFSFAHKSSMKSPSSLLSAWRSLTSRKIKI